MYIGNSIKSFKSNTKIKDYVSPVGNSDIPYPYAVDENDDYYLMIEDVIVKNVPDEYKDDVYEYYYRDHDNEGETDMVTEDLKFSIVHERI